MLQIFGEFAFLSRISVMLSLSSFPNQFRIPKFLPSDSVLTEYTLGSSNPGNPFISSVGANKPPLADILSWTRRSQPAWGISGPHPPTQDLQRLTGEKIPCLVGILRNCVSNCLSCFM